MRDDSATWLTHVKSQATVFAEAYRLRLVGRLWWTNLLLVVLPAVAATAAAVFAARPETSGSGFGRRSRPATFTPQKSVRAIRCIANSHAT